MRKRLSWRRWTAAILFAAITLSIGVMSPVSGHNIVCCPRLALPPRPSSAILSRIIERYLRQHPPIVRIDLQRPLGSYAPVRYDDLARAGLLRIIAGKRGFEPGPSYGLTAKGRKLLLNNGAISPNTKTIYIPVGHFWLVPGSAIFTRGEMGRPATDFKYYFHGNHNATTLLRAGPAIDWVLSNYWRPHVNLRRVGRVAAQILPLEFCYGKWIVRKLPPCEIP